jgi:hypothetical protein
MVGASPLSLGNFENVQNWADDLGLSLKQEQRAPESMEVGNLAALEDDPIPGGLGQSSKPPPPPPIARPTPIVQQAPVQPPPVVQQPPLAAPRPPQPTPIPPVDLQAPRPPASSNNAILYIILGTVVVLAALAVAYFRGLIGR